MNTTLIIMAAGIGSRYGKGIKQLAKIGPHDEIIMDYSIYDALEAGFNKVVFIKRKDIQKKFKEIICKTKLKKNQLSKFLKSKKKKNLKKLLVIALKNTFKLNMFSKKLIMFLKDVVYLQEE